MARSIWWRYNWIRPFAFLMAARESGSRAGLNARLVPRAAAISAHEIPELMQRRSWRRFRGQSVAAGDLATAMEAIDVIIADEPYLGAYLAASAVEGLSRGIHVWSRRENGFALVSLGFDPRVLLTIGQGQAWTVAGGGGVVFLTVNWKTLEELEGDGPDAYLRLLVAAGRCAHAGLIRFHLRGLATSMTPALDEAVASDFLGLSAEDEPIYMLKFGVPAGRRTDSVALDEPSAIG